MGQFLGVSHIVVETGVYFVRDGYILGASQDNIIVEKGDKFSEGRVDSGRVIII